MGPTYHLNIREQNVTLQALWSDTEGVCVSVDVSPDATFTAADIAEVRAALDDLLGLEPPAQSTELTGAKSGR